jgi:hypothetical protein
MDSERKVWVDMTAVSLGLLFTRLALCAGGEDRAPGLKG